MIQIAEIELDFETRSEVNLLEVGARRYAEDPTTEVLCLSYRLDEGPMQRWDPRMDFDCPADLDHAIRGRAELWAHGSMFERSIWEYIMVARYGWVSVFPKQWRCTLALSAYRALPLKLETAAEVLHLQERKDDEGHKLMKKMTKPRKPTKKNPAKWYYSSADHDRLFGYCDQDIRTESGLKSRLGTLPAPELALWQLDQKINFRGVQIDLDFVDAALDVISQVEERLLKKLNQLTNGDVQTAGQRDRIIVWCATHAVFLPNLTAETVTEALDQPAYEAAHPVLKIRQTLALASTNKYKTMRAVACANGRAHGLLQYCGAHTSRWAGRLIQPQNFPRPTIKPAPDPNEIVGAIMQRDPELLDMVYGGSMSALSNALKHAFIAAPGRILNVADFSAIEAVVTAWLAGEEWKLDAFRAFQRGELFGGAEDMYCLTASEICRRTIVKADLERQTIGKVAELAFGFGGGLGAWRNFDASDTYSDEEVEDYKDGWRKKHPMTRAMWKGLEEAAIAAVANPDKAYSYRSMTYQMNPSRDWLTCRFSNGNLLWYYAPRLEEVELPWSTAERPAYGIQLTYYVMKDGHWQKVHTYGGKLTENNVQKIARDLMADAMPRAEAAGYPIVLTGHDELTTEPHAGGADYKVLEQIMESSEDWADGCPVAAAGWEGNRYRK